jgi:cytidine deaminase
MPMEHRSEDRGGALAPRDRDLVDAAAALLSRAHAPYSGVRVGAALRARDGRVFLGVNVENASYGLTLCAERNAVAAAIAAGAREFDTIAITTSLPGALPPCGACRQVLHEFAPGLRVVTAGADGAWRATTLADLLPGAFGPDDLRRR